MSKKRKKPARRPPGPALAFGQPIHLYDEKTGETMAFRLSIPAHLVTPDLIEHLRAEDLNPEWAS